MAVLASFPVTGRSKEALEEITTNFLLETFPGHLESPGKLDVPHLIDCKIFKTHKIGFMIDDELGIGVEGLTCPEKKVIKVPSKVFEKLYSGDGRARFTACHEVIHALLHISEIENIDRENIGSYFSLARQAIPKFKDPEWQANYGAGALLMPKSTLIPFVNKLKSVNCWPNVIIAQVCETYGVSQSAAKTRLSQLGLLKSKKTSTWGS